MIEFQANSPYTKKKDPTSKIKESKQNKKGREITIIS
jgi:hypothetical protein